MKYTYGKGTKRPKMRYTAMHRYSMGGHQSSSQRRTGRIVHPVMRAIRSARQSGYGVSFPPAYRDNVGESELDKRKRSPMYAFAMDVQDAASAVAEALADYSQTAITQTVRGLERATGVPVSDIPRRVAYAFAGTVATQMARGVPLAVAVKEAAYAAGSFGRGAIRAAFRRR